MAAQAGEVAAPPFPGGCAWNSGRLDRCLSSVRLDSGLRWQRLLGRGINRRWNEDFKTGILG